jgi:DNA polymerase-1
MYKILPLEQASLLIDARKPLFCDTETCGFYGTVRLLQMNQVGWSEVILVEWPSPLQLLMLLQGNHTVWHNAHYDLTTVQQQTTSRFVPERYDDTFLAARLTQPEADAFSLDAVMARVVGYDPYEAQGLDKKVLQKSDWSKAELSKEQLLYAATDVKWMPEVWEAVKAATYTMSYKLDKLSLNAALDFQWNGMPVASKRLDKKYSEVVQQLASVDMPINANSWQQVRKWLSTDKSDKIHLSKLALAGDDRAQAVMDVRSCKKLIGFMEKYDVERVIGKFKPSARSGRFTSDDENLQQIPRALKEAFGYEEGEGRVLIYSDYAQIELRTIAAMLNVELMVKMFREDIDLHGFVASQLFGEDWTKADRQVTKTYNFNLLYGGSIFMVLSILATYGMLVDERSATRHQRKWLNLFPEIARWQKKETQNWRQGKLGTTPLGRQYKGKLMTDQMNIQNQGAGAEVAKLALHYFCPWLLEYNMEHGSDVKLCNFIHDSFIIDAPDDPVVYKEVSVKLAECMQEAWFEMSKLYTITDLPMPVDVAVGYNWGDIEGDVPNLWEFKLDPYTMLAKVKG